MPSFTSSLLPFPSHFLVVPHTHTHFLLPFFLLFIYFCNNKQCLARQNKRLIKDNCSEKLSRRVENSFAFSCRVLWIQVSATINKVLLFCSSAEPNSKCYEMFVAKLHVSGMLMLCSSSIYAYVCFSSYAHDVNRWRWTSQRELQYSVWRTLNLSDALCTVKAKPLSLINLSESCGKKPPILKTFGFIFS